MTQDKLAVHIMGYLDASTQKVRDILSNQELPKGVRQHLLELFDDLHRAGVCLKASKEESNEPKQESA